MTSLKRITKQGQNLLLDMVIAHIFEFPIAPSDLCKNMAISSIPTECFGVFVTIRAGRPLSKWPNDIYGCIGWWNSSFEFASQNTLFTKTLQVAHDAAWQDDRRNYFPPLAQDLETTIEIDFMMKHWEVNSETGEISQLSELFNNDEYGLMVQQGDKRATYLPGVFNAISWPKLKASLLDKSKINDRLDQVKFFAYNIIQFKKTIWEMLDADFFRCLFLPKIIEFLNNHYDEFVPFVIENDQVVRDEKEVTRNIATIYDMYRAGTVFTDTLSRTVIENMTKNIADFAEKYDHHELHQGAAFLLLALGSMKIRQDLIEPICSDLISKLPDMEPNFELGESLIALETHCAEKAAEFEQEAQKYMSNEKKDDDRLFRLNWQAQYIATRWHFRPDPSLVKHAKFLSKSIVEIVQTFDLNSVETNYIAVAFEGLSSLFVILGKPRDIQREIWRLFSELQKRTDSHGLISFLNKASRLDITGHVINGIETII